MKRSGFGLAAVIMSGIEVFFIALIILALIYLQNDNSLKQLFEESAGGSLIEFGYSYSEFISLMFTILIIMLFSIIIKFVLSLLGYLKRNSVLYLIAAILASIGLLLAFFLTEEIWIIIFEIVLTAFLWIALASTKKNAINSLDNVNQREKKTRIDIDL